MKKILIFSLVVIGLLNGQSSNSVTNVDPLSETPLFPIPSEMTFDEYQDMNRRISMGLLLSAIPMPGTIHNYAGESKTAKKLILEREQAL